MYIKILNDNPVFNSKLFLYYTKKIICLLTVTDSSSYIDFFIKSFVNNHSTYFLFINHKILVKINVYMPHISISTSIYRTHTGNHIFHATFFLTS